MAASAVVLFGMSTLFSLPDILYSDLTTQRLAGTEPFSTSPFKGFSLLVIGVIAVCFLLWLLARICLVFPHVAVTGKLNPALSWAAMRRKFWYWLFIFLIIAIAVGLLAGALTLLTGLLTTALGPPAAIREILYQSTTHLVFTVVAGFAEAVNIAALSFIYQGITKSGTPSTALRSATGRKSSCGSEATTPPCPERP